MAKKVIVVLIALSAFSATATAMGGSGVRGGGESVDYQKHPRLRDLVDTTPCEWESAGEFVNSNAGFNQMLASLKNLHWYLAGVIARETNYLNLCLTGELRRVPTEDADSASWFATKTQQAAVRIDNTIYLNRKIFESLPSDDQGMLLIHEISHSFLALDIPARNDKLRSFVRAIYQHYVAPKTMSQQKFALNMRMNEVQLIDSTASLEGVHTDAETLLDPRKPEFARLTALQHIGYDSLTTNFWPGDRNNALAFAAPIFDDAQAAVKSKSLAQVQLVLARGVDPAFRFYENGQKTLLDLAAHCSTQEIITLLLSGTEDRPSPPERNPSANDEIMFQIIRGKIETRLVDRLIRAGVNPNSMGRVSLPVAVTFPPSREEPPVKLLTMLSATIYLGKYDLTAKLAAIPGITADTWSEALAYLLAANASSGNAVAVAALSTHAIDPNTPLESGRSLLSESVLAANADIFDAAVAAGADINAVDAMGFTAFDYAFQAQAQAFAAKLLSNPQFHFVLNTTGDVAQVHSRAKWILAQFVDLNQPLAVALMLAQHHFGWFDLYPLAEKARINGYTDVEQELRKAMERKK